jgi:hypothetical protein
MVTAPSSSTTSPPKKNQEWADISDDDEEDSAPTVKVDTLNLNSLSLNENNKETPAQTGDSL